MYTKRRYSFWLTLKWSSAPLIYGFIYSLIIASILQYFSLQFFVPWQPISVIGIAVAFYLGFKNNSSYDRTWEARKIWGSLVNNSRTFGAAVIAFIQGDQADVYKKELIYRHVAWLTALRYQLRLSRPWEHTEIRMNDKFNPTICEEYNHKLNTELSQYIDQDEIDNLSGKANAATQLMKTQSKRLQELHDQKYFDDFRHMEFHKLLQTFYADQGKSERIKNFPFPRQYASAAIWLLVVFCVFVPFGLTDVFKDVEGWLYWTWPFISGIIIWIFFLMEKIGDYSENPFEGTYNDVPITTIARGIEIDMREMINDDNIPPAFKDDNGFLM